MTTNAAVRDEIRLLIDQHPNLKASAMRRHLERMADRPGAAFALDDIPTERTIRTHIAEDRLADDLEEWSPLHATRDEVEAVLPVWRARTLAEATWAQLPAERGRTRIGALRPRLANDEAELLVAYRDALEGLGPEARGDLVARVAVRRRRGEPADDLLWYVACRPWASPEASLEYLVGRRRLGLRAGGPPTWHEPSGDPREVRAVTLGAVTFAMEYLGPTRSLYACDLGDRPSDVSRRGNHAADLGDPSGTPSSPAPVDRRVRSSRRPRRSVPRR